jgi:hypothetical protein
MLAVKIQDMLVSETVQLHAIGSVGCKEHSEDVFYCKGRHDCETSAWCFWRFLAKDKVCTKLVNYDGFSLYRRKRNHRRSGVLRRFLFLFFFLFFDWV